MIKNIKLVIFDLDGTLVDAYPAITSSVNRTLKKFGLPPRDKKDIRKAVGWGDRNLLKPFVKAEDLDPALKFYRRDHAKELLRSARLLPGAANTLDYLKKKGYILCVASNRPTRFSLIIIRHLRLKKYFYYILCADKLKRMKPHPEILRRILSRFRAEPKEAVYIGDMSIDVRTAKAAGVSAVAVATGSGSLKELKSERPLSVIKKLAFLKRLL